MESTEYVTAPESTDAVRARAKHSLRRWAWVQFDRVARRRGLAVTLVGVSATLLSASVSWFLAWPVPKVHDEFAYLLAADTFAHGRFANSPHPMAAFLETFYVIQQPTYASMYHPAQGLALAVGQMLAGQPIVGVWLSFGLACAAICWMLHQWLPARWALLGSLLAMLQLGFVGSTAGMPGYWSQSYWGGAVAALGGALVFGAFRQVIDRPTIRSGAILGFGLVVLANSRPFEGLVASAPAVIAIGVRAVRKPTFRSALVKRSLLPFALVLSCGAALMTLYNFRTTGNPLISPYLVATKEYAATPAFIWQATPATPTYHHQVLHDHFAGWAVAKFRDERTSAGFVKEAASRLGTAAVFYSGHGILLIACLALPFSWRRPWPRFAVATCALVMVNALQTSWFQPHYLAPIAGLVYYLLAEAVRQLRSWRRRERLGGPFVARVVLVSFLAVALVSIVTRPSTDGAWFIERSKIQSRLGQDGDRHLMIVRYGPKHSTHDEWVFNAADIDGSRVVWARDMGKEANQPLLDYFHDRKTWLLEIDEPEIRWTPYPN